MKILLFTISFAVSAMALTMGATSNPTLAPPAPRPTASGAFSFIPPSQVHSYTGSGRPTKSAAAIKHVSTFGIAPITRVPVPVSGVDTKVELAPPVGTFLMLPWHPTPSDMPAPVHVKPDNEDPDDNTYTCLIPEGCGSTAVEAPEPTEFTAVAQPTTLTTSYKRTIPLLPPVQ